MRTKYQPYIAAIVFCTLLLAACQNKNTIVVQKENKKDTASVVPTQALGLSVYQLDGTLVTQDNKTITLNDLKGKVQVIAMVFTNCRYACPKIVSDMQNIEKAIPAGMLNKVGFTLVSFDVARDTVARLKIFAKQMGLDNNWTLLHGNEEEVRELSLLLDVNYERLENGDYNHTSVISILNPDGVVIHRHEGLEMDTREMVQKIVGCVK